MKEYRPIVHIPHSMKFPNLERNVFLVVMFVLLIITSVAIYKIESREQERARIQHMQEEKALQEKHAVSVVPFRSDSVQKIPDWVFEARKQQP